ncbi:hypothetical protein AALB16_09440 [Lachnospiraceae bacterium 62-35]
MKKNQWGLNHAISRKMNDVAVSWHILCRALLISLAWLLLSGCSKNEEPTGQSLYERGTSLIEKMDRKAESKEYAKMVLGAPEVMEIIDEIGKGDYSEVTAAYKVTLDPEGLDKLLHLAETNVSDLPKELQEDLRTRLVKGIPAMLSSLSGSEVLAASSLLMTEECFLFQGLSSPETHIYLYGEDYFAIVAFVPFEDNVVAAYGNFVSSQVLGEAVEEEGVKEWLEKASIFSDCCKVEEIMLEGSEDGKTSSGAKNSSVEKSDSKSEDSASKDVSSGWEGQEAENRLTGRFLKDIDGRCLIITDEGGPIVMRCQSGLDSMFDGLNTGDKIQIVCSGVEETYPGRTEVYDCEQIEIGSAQDIPKEVYESLEELGWKFPAVSSKETEEEGLCAYLKGIEGGRVQVDIAEYITDEDKDRMAELHLTENDLPDGYYIYNPDEEITELPLGEDILYEFIDWGRDFVTDEDESLKVITASQEVFIRYLDTYENSSPGMPFFFQIEDGKVRRIVEKPMA